MPANTPKSGKKRAATKTTWKPGQSGNPQGAPKRGESWAEIIKRVGDLTPHEAAQSSLELAKQFLKIGEGVTLKEAVILRVYGALLFEPNPGLLNAFMNRVEGMPSQSVDMNLSWKERAKQAGYDPSEIERQARSAVAGIIAGSDSGDAPESGDGGNQ